MISPVQVDRGSFWAYINVTSSDMDIAQISSVVGRMPDRSHAIGDVSSVTGKRYDWSSWKMDLELDKGLHAGTEGLSRGIECLPFELADALAALTSRNCDVVINVVQEFDESDGTTGLHLTGEALQWMSRARCSLDVDQYVLVETADSSGHGAT